MGIDPNNILIVNLIDDDCDVYCGKGSNLGNPFNIRLESQRDEMCDKYEVFLNTRLEEGHQGTYEQLNRILAILKLKGSVKLGCYCAPKRCHCETIKKIIIQLFS